MAKKTHVKVRLVPEAKPDSPFFYYVKKPAGGEKAKVKLSAKKYNPATRKHEMFVEKKLKLSKFGTFSIRAKKSRIGRNPKTKEQTTISNRDVVLFKASKEFRDLVNSKNDS